MEMSEDNFFSLEKCTLDGSWPLSKTSYWNLHPNTEHEVELLFPYEIEFPLSRRLVTIVDKDKMDAHKKMMHDLNKLYNEVKEDPRALVDPQTLIPGQMIVFWSFDLKSFVRGNILSKEGENIVKVHMVDHGDTIELTTLEIYPLCTIFTNVQGRAIVIHLDGLQKFDRLNLLKNIMKRTVDWSARWRMSVTRHEAGRIYCNLKQLTGDSDYLHKILLKELWTLSPEPQLPKVNKTRIRGYVVNIKPDGKMAIQFDSPYATAFQEYISSAKKVLDQLILDEVAFANKVARLPLDPNEVYMAPYGPNCVFFRAKYIPDNKVPPGHARLKFIDYGNEEIEGVGRILMASKIHELLSFVPPQCIETQLVNVISLDLNRTHELFDDNTAVTVRTIAARDPSKGPQLQVFVPKIAEDGTKSNFCLSTYLASKGLAETTEDPMPLGVKEEFAQLEYIEMIDSTDWSVTAPSTLASVNTPTSLKSGQIIFFRVNSIPDPDDFIHILSVDSEGRPSPNSTELTIQPLGAEEVTRELSQLLLSHVKQPWYRRMKKDCKFRPRMFNKDWFYAYYSNEKSRFYRARLEGSVTANEKQAQILLIDLASYVENVDVTELERSIPLKVCNIGPQAARVHQLKIRDNSFFSPDDPGFSADGRPKTCAFKKIYVGKDKICTAQIIGVSHDGNGVTSLSLDYFKVVKENSCHRT